MIRDGEENLIYEGDGFTVCEVSQLDDAFVSVGYPDRKCRVYFCGTGISSVEVKSPSGHKCRQMCIDIGELFGKGVE